VTNNPSVVRCRQADASFTGSEPCIAPLITYQALIAMHTFLPLGFHQHYPGILVKPRGWSKDRAPIS
jgi:hypothetical protein